MIWVWNTKCSNECQADCCRVTIDVDIDGIIEMSRLGAVVISTVYDVGSGTCQLGADRGLSGSHLPTEFLALGSS